MIQKTRLLITLSCLVLLAVFASACATPPAAAPTEVPAAPTALQIPTAVPAATEAPATSAPTASSASGSGSEVMGAELFQVACAQCHGADRKGSDFTMDGQTISVPALGWDDLNTTYSTDPSRGTVEQQIGLSITKGVDETGGDLNVMMPHWSSLSQAQVDSLVQYLHTAGTGTASASSLTGAAADLQGEQLYQAACASCHGADAAGLTFHMDGNKITTPSLHWADLTQTYSADASRGTVEQQVALGITKGQDETGGDLNAMMPHWTFLSQAQVDSLVQYLKTKFP